MLALMSGTALAGFAPVAAAAQTDRIDFEDTLARLSGVSPLPRSLISNLVRALQDGPEPEGDGEADLLKALYSGVLASKDGPGMRIGFSDALMWHAVEDYKNAISYCGGLPGFWARPPDIG
jgi:hypothetical protein